MKDTTEDWMKMSLPERVNAMRVVTYVPAEVKDSLVLMNPDMEITDEEVLALIEEWAYEDFGNSDFILQDENGDEL